MENDGDGDGAVTVIGDGAALAADRRQPRGAALLDGYLGVMPWGCRARSGSAPACLGGSLRKLTGAAPSPPHLEAKEDHARKPERSAAGKPERAVVPRSVEGGRCSFAT